MSNLERLSAGQIVSVIVNGVKHDIVPMKLPDGKYKVTTFANGRKESEVVVGKDGLAALLHGQEGGVLAKAVAKVKSVISSAPEPTPAPKKVLVTEKPKKKSKKD